jgi:hypothetical protein
MNSGATTISGSRVSGVSRRTDTIRKPRALPLGFSVHVVLIVLSVLVWWIARDMVSVTQQLKDASRLRFELSEELRNEWRIIPPDERNLDRRGAQGDVSIPNSVEVSGPTKRLNDFASELAANSGRYAPAPPRENYPDRRCQRSSPAVSSGARHGGCAADTLPIYNWSAVP